MKGPLVPWSAREISIVPKTVHDPAVVVEYAVQLSRREREQIAKAFATGSYEMVSVFVWTKATAAMRRRLSSLGMDFIGQMLGRPDIDAFSSIDQSVTDHELINLAADLGIFSSTEAMRMRQTQELIVHFAAITGPDSDSESMLPEEAMRSIRVSIDAILGHEEIELSHQFVEFRRNLENRTFQSTDKEISDLRSSPEFFKRATVSILLAQLRSAKGAAAEHTWANVKTIIPFVWEDIPKPLRWQIGQAYAELHSQGKAMADAAKALRQALVEVKGFDYVPETLRSNTYAAAAERVLRAHEGFDNFHTEVPVIKHLASLGTSIPMPAFPVVMRAILSVFLGNKYGHSFHAEPVATQMLANLGKENWIYYLRECLPGDRIVLGKISDYALCQERWLMLLKQFDLDKMLPKGRDPIAGLVHASGIGQSKIISTYAKRLYTAAGPSMSKRT